MKLLDSLATVLEEEQIKALEKFLLSQANLRTIVWEDVLDNVIKNFDDLEFEKIFFLEKFDINKLSKEMQSVFISTIALLQEDAVIQDTISTHEMIQKDEVKSINDIGKKSIGILSGADERQHNRNIEIKNNILSLIPVTVQKYDPFQINVLYYPSSLEYIVGNIPDNDAVQAGTFSGYWSADIYTNRRNPVGAIVTLEYPSVINFNNIDLRGASTYPLKLNTLEYYNDAGAVWVDITPDMEYSKDFFLTFQDTYLTTKIRMDLQQPHYDYIWKKEVDDAFIIRNTVITGRDITLIKNNRIEQIIKDEPLELIDRETIENKFKYEVGAYNINVFLKTFINQDGVFRSRAFQVDDVINDVKILSTATALGDITYRLIQSNSSYVEYLSSTDLPTDTKIPITTNFFKSEKHTDLEYNKIELENYPFIEPPTYDVVTKVNGTEATFVEKFTGTNELEFIVSGNSVYVNTNLRGKLVEVRYWHKTNSVVLEVILNTGGDGFTFYSPEVSFLDLEINGIKQS